MLGSIQENILASMLIDSHTHLTDERYGGAADIIGNLRNDGLLAAISVGYDLKSSVDCVNIAKANQGVYAAVGIHPSDTGNVDSLDIDSLMGLTTQNKVVAIGEIGLDYHYDDTDRPTQKLRFVEQLDKGLNRGVPFIFHVRDAYGDFDDIIASYRGIKAVMHCYSGSKESARKYLDYGFYISFAGAVTFKNAVNLQEVAKYVPADRLLTETDCPYLTPTPMRGQLNYPKYVAHTAKFLSQIRNEDYDEFCKQTVTNTLQLFDRIKLD